jgi:hypothetical protein
MNPLWIELPWLVALTLYVIAVEWRLRKHIVPMKELVSEETRRKVAHTKAFERLIDPDVLDQEFEASGERNALQIEAIQAGRVTVPREGAGPNAVIHRPRKMRPVTPRRWNPPADYSDRVRDMTERRNRGEGYQ